jgi:hypothetical protein
MGQILERSFHLRCSHVLVKAEMPLKEFQRKIHISLQAFRDNGEHIAVWKGASERDSCNDDAK